MCYALNSAWGTGTFQGQWQRGPSLPLRKDKALVLLRAHPDTLPSLGRRLFPSAASILKGLIRTWEMHGPHLLLTMSSCKGGGYPGQGFLCVSAVKNPPAMQEIVGSIPGSGRSPREGNATHSSILAWESPWTEEPGWLQSMASQRLGHDGSD